MELKSSKFGNGQRIPLKYTGLDLNINPPLEITNAPAAAKSFILWIEDANSGLKPWIHWLVFNIPAEIIKIGEGDSRIKEFEGLANGGAFGYEGPNQKYFTGTHRYFFKVFASNSFLNISKQSVKDQVEEAMKNFIIGKAQLLGICTSPFSDQEVKKNLEMV